jgi:hypothetical protein
VHFYTTERGRGKCSLRSQHVAELDHFSTALVSRNRLFGHNNSEGKTTVSDVIVAGRAYRMVHRLRQPFYDIFGSNDRSSFSCLTAAKGTFIFSCRSHSAARVLLMQLRPSNRLSRSTRFIRPHVNLFVFNRFRRNIIILTYVTYSLYT